MHIMPPWDGLPIIISDEREYEINRRLRYTKKLNNIEIPYVDFRLDLFIDRYLFAKEKKKKKKERSLYCFN
jgi:hypothetical protein